MKDVMQHPWFTTMNWEVRPWFASTPHWSALRSLLKVCDGVEWAGLQFPGVVGKEATAAHRTRHHQRKRLESVRHQRFVADECCTVYSYQGQVQLGRGVLEGCK